MKVKLSKKVINIKYLSLFIFLEFNKCFNVSSYLSPYTIQTIRFAWLCAIVYWCFPTFLTLISCHTKIYLMPTLNQFSAFPALSLFEVNTLLSVHFICFVIDSYFVNVVFTIKITFNWKFNSSIFIYTFIRSINNFTTF